MSTFFLLAGSAHLSAPPCPDETAGPTAASAHAGQMGSGQTGSGQLSRGLSGTSSTTGPPETASQDATMTVRSAINKKNLRELSLRTVLKVADLAKAFPDNWEAMAENTVLQRA